MDNITKVGVGVLIFKDNKILMGKRKSSHGEGEYATPGGHLEYMETFEQCAIRETLEETGMEIKNLRFLYVANMKRYAPKHYVHIQLIADWKKGEPKILEPDKTEEWKWYDLSSIPSPLFETTKWTLISLEKGINYFD